MADEKESKKSIPDEVTAAQFARDLSHILIQHTPKGAVPKGPKITLGGYELQFMEKAPVAALAELIGNENRVEGMKNYIRLTLEDGADDLDELFKVIDMDGLGEIINVLGEAYTSFPAKS
jgi:hypothetical protein